MSREEKVLLDLNNPELQQDLFALGKSEQRSVLLTCRKLVQMTWDQIYRDAGLKWEAVLSKSTSTGKRVYSLRIGKGFRALACRDGRYLRLLSLHPDHDSAYKR